MLYSKIKVISIATVVFCCQNRQCNFNLEEENFAVKFKACHIRQIK
jgi:hypothetical protein